MNEEKENWTLFVYDKAFKLIHQEPILEMTRYHALAEAARRIKAGDFKWEKWKIERQTI